MSPKTSNPLIVKLGDPAALNTDNEWTEKDLIPPRCQELAPDDLVQLQSTIRYDPLTVCQQQQCWYWWLECAALAIPQSQA